MSTSKKIYKNTSYLAIAEVISRVLQFVVMMYAARILTKGDFGKFSFALAISFIAIIFADLGINTLFIREVARKKSLVSKYFVNAFFTKIGLSVMTFMGLVVTLGLLGYSDDSKQIVYIIWVFAILSTFTELFYAVFRSFEKMQYDALIKITRMVILSVTSLFVLFSGLGVVFFCYMFVLTEVVIVILAYLIARKHFLKKLVKYNISFAIKLLKKSLPFGLALVFGSVYFFIGTVILSHLKGDAEVAIFSVAYNLALAILFIPTVYTNAIYPVLSRYYKTSKQKLQILYERSFKYLYIIGLPISAGILVLSAEIIELLYGTGYIASTVVLQIIALYLFIKFINFLLGIVLSSINKQNKRMAGQGITAFFNIGINLLLIPSIGFVGAALATLITEVFLFLVYFFFVSRSWYTFNFLKILSKPLIAAFAMVIFIMNTNFHLIITVILGALVYFIALFVIRTLDKKDYQIIKSIIH